MAEMRRGIKRDNMLYEKKKNNATFKLIVAFFFLVAFELWTFRNIIFSGMLLGNNEDGMLAILMTEHWYKVLCGFEKWNNWISMYPVRNTVALNDMYILHAIFYCPLRFFGVDKYMAYQAAVILIHACGSVCMMLFLNKALKFDAYYSLLGTACFSYGSYYVIKLVHSQLVSLAVVPLIMTAAYLFVYYVIYSDKKRRILWMFIGILGEVLLFYSSPYVAEFVLITLSIYLVALIIISDKKSLFGGVLNYIKHSWYEPLLGVACGILLMIPFCLVYFPWRGENVRSYKYASAFFISFRDLFNVSNGNLLYGRLISELPFTFGENTVGLTPVMWLLAICSIVVAFRNKDKVICALAITFIVLIFVPMRIKGHCLWSLFYSFFPGASGMRVVCRLFLMILPLLAVLVSYSCVKISEKLGGNKGSDSISSLFVIIAICIVFENSLTSRVPSAWNHESAIVSEAEFDVAPPEDCESFYLVDSAGTPEQAEFPAYYQGFLNAWRIADKYDVPSINGFGSFTPKKYKKTYNIYAENYMEEVAAWIETNNLQGVYSYDLATKEWKRN
ncbi:hypothetical protein [Butyrivibrio sp. WCD2001]|uniref:hypothetical protein n=1 Tax=Butyrivibrio sp. WCD2001 TaxID=1280681 RepID=UPI00047AD0C7|nr:hypothetical protein [Butyrivibrio sp. WCD2001]